MMFFSMHKSFNRILLRKQRKGKKKCLRMDQNISEEKKTKSENMLGNDVETLEDEKQILIEYRKKYSKMQKVIKTS